MKRLFILIIFSFVLFSSFAQDSYRFASPYTNLSVPETRKDEENIPFPNTVISDAGRVISSKQIEEPDPYGQFNDAGLWNDWIVYRVEILEFSDGHHEERKVYLGRRHIDETGQRIVQ